MANLFKRLIDTVFGPDAAPAPPLSPEDLARGEQFIFEIFAQQKAKAWQPVGTVLFAPRLRRRSGCAHLMDDAMGSMLAKGWVETHHVRYLVLTDAGYARMRELGIASAA